MKISRTFLCIAILSVLFSSLSSLCLGFQSYSGSLSSNYPTLGDGLIVGEDGWVSDPNNPLVFSWIVSQNPDASWHYQYTLNRTNLQGGLSHIIIETSLELIRPDIFNETISIEPNNPKWHKSGPGNPDMPEDLFGVKFQPFSGLEIETISFVCLRLPVWGDFYAKDGAPGGTAWNAGFTVNDIDPTVPPANGSVDHHILVPDAYIPEPTTILLCSFGVGLARWLHRHKIK